MDNKNNKDDSSSSSTNKKKPQRTIQVKIGGQAAKTMTPDQAAEYLKSIAGKHAFGREVKMTFNSSGVGNSSSTSSSHSAGSSSSRHHHHRMSATSVAAEEMAAAAAAKQHQHHRNSNNNGAARGSNNKDGMPCSEKEMKALMSMFVEIMGLQMNTDKLNKSNPILGGKNHHHHKRTGAGESGLFSFPPDLPPPPGGWPEDLMWPKGDSDDDNDNNGAEEEDSLPDLEDVVRRDDDDEEVILTNGSSNRNNNHRNNATTTNNIALFCEHSPTLMIDPEPVTGVDGIAAFEWEALERVAIEDALEQEERARKAAKKRDAKSSYKQQKKKEQARKEAQAKAAEVFAKKREKAIQSFKSRVIQAAQLNHQASLKHFLTESPFKEDESTNVVKPHVDELVQTCVVPKNRKSLAVGKGTREILTTYIRMLSLKSLLDPTVLRNGRSVLHTCCFYADTSMMNLIISAPSGKKSSAVVTQEELHLTCHDSGWAPLHYASLSGSLAAVELLLSHGCSLKKTTNDTHTWRTSNGKGLTARQLVECILAGKQDQDIETHGMALEDLTKDFQLSNSSSNNPSLERRRYLALLEVVAERLKDVEANGYSALTKEEITKKEKLAQRSFSHQDSTAGSDTTVKKGKKKKKKAVANEGAEGTKNNKSETTAAAASTESSESQVEENPASSGSTSLAATRSKEESSKLPDDPLVMALLGMGFEQKRIMDGIAACGGINRATADDVVAWIVGGQDDDAANMAAAEEQQFELVSDSGTVEEDRKLAAKETKGRQTGHNAKTAAKSNKRQEAAKRAEEERVAAERLAAKREEQRRRNREWNKRQEAQAKAGTSARPGGGLPPAPPNVATKSAPRDLSVSPSPGGSQQFAPPDRSIPYEFVPATDASTVASSIDDDATISTMGSLQARVTPVMGQLPNPPKMAQQVAPPGFGQSSSISPREIPSRPSVDSRSSSSRVYSAPASVMPPPGIPETRPLVEQSLPSSSVFASNTLGGLQPRLATAQDTLATSAISGYGIMGIPLASGSGVPSSNANIGSSHLFGTGAAPTPGYGDMHLTSLEGVSPVPSSTASSVSGPPIPCTGLIGSFGLDNNKSQKIISQQQQLDSSIIDSISTGNTAVLAGATLWGDTMAAGTGSSGGTSLLGSILQTGSALEEPPPTTTTMNSNPFATHNQDNNDSRTPGWGSTSSQATDFQRSGSGSIW